jgi:NAD(P)H-dependent flavin oxidoreductase YrpB (nitropropane dioxygenase family)
MSELQRPWIAYKVLAAGAIHPRSGFQHAFDNGADFINVGMFDFQVAENAAVVGTAIRAAQNREREWVG